MDRIEDFEVNSPRWLSLENFEGEVWKDVPEYDGLYRISNLGRLKYLVRDNETIKKEKIRRQCLNKDGYLCCSLKKENKRKLATIHRIVALVFIPNPNDYPIINHKNEIKTDNKTNNLEWCTIEYNVVYSAERRNKELIEEKNYSFNTISGYSTRIPVYQYTTDGVYINKFANSIEAETITGISRKRIVVSCKTLDYAGGYIWSYSNSKSDIDKRIDMRKARDYSCKSRKAVDQYTPDGKFIKSYKSIKEASRQTGIWESIIRVLCSNKDFIWKYHEESISDKDTQITDIKK